MDLRDQLQDHLGQAFRIERELGGGGMSRVFVATEVRLSRQVVVKVLSPELAQGLNAERFEREILLAASLQQANIVPVLAAGDVGGLPYFTMPFVDGESLRNRIGRGMPIAQVTAIVRDVAKALAYAHQRGIVHRDIKPDNVLLSGGTAVVTDFGIAKALSASRTDGGQHATLTSVGTSIGTPAYMAPEQVAGDPNIDHRVDLYALGCMAFELLTGKSPFADHPPQRMLAAHLSEIPRPVESVRPDCPPALALLVARLLEKDPADRLGSAEEVVQLLDQAATTSSPTTALTPKGRFARALVIYLLALGAVWILAKAAVVGIGLPSWTVMGAVGVMLLGLPVLLVTGWAKWMARKAATATPTLTPGGSSVPRPPSGTMATIAIRANRHLSFRRTMRGGLIAMGGFVVLITAFMVTRAMGIGPAASLFATGSLTAQDKIVLADFTTQDSTYVPILAEAVRSAMGQSNAVKLVPATDVAATLTEMRLPAEVAVTDSIAREVAQRRGAKAILGGKLVPAGSGFLVSLELRKADNGATLASFQGTADAPTDLLTVVDDLTRKLRSKIGESLKSVANTVPLERATTSSLEALRLYSEAARANDIETDYDKAITLSRQALAEDSTFALAWRKLGVAINNANGSTAAVDSAFEMAMRYSDKLPPLERLVVQATYHDNHVTGWDRPRAIEEYRQVLKLDSTNLIVLNNLALNLQEAGRDDSALALVRAQLRLQPGLANQMKLVLALAATGRLDAATAMLDSVRTAPGTDTTTAGFLLFATALAWSNNNLPQAAEFSRQLASSSGVSDRMYGLRMGAGTAYLAGQPAAGAALAAREDSLAQTRDYGNAIPGIGSAFGKILFGTDPADGVAALDRMVSSAEWRNAAPADRPWFDVITLYARGGAPDKAAGLLAAFRRDWPEAAASDAMISRVAIAEGEIALARGDAQGAIAKFRVAVERIAQHRTLCGPCALEGMARAFDAMHQDDSTRAYLERYEAIPVVNRNSIYIGISGDPGRLAGVRKRLGELYDAAGEKQKALEQYGAFVQQWQAAEPALQPTVEQVKRRIAELTATEN